VDVRADAVARRGLDVFVDAALAVGDAGGPAVGARLAQAARMQTRASSTCGWTLGFMPLSSQLALGLIGCNRAAAGGESSLTG
jgi:hypothetical protein